MSMCCVHGVSFLIGFVILGIVWLVFRRSPRKQLGGEHILITGAGQGIGAEFARQFADMGNTVHCVDIRRDLVSGVVDKLRESGHEAYCYVCDLSKADEVQKLYDDIKTEGYHISYLINNAGLANGTELIKMPLSAIQLVISVNTTAPLMLTSLFLKDMLSKNQGHIVNIASVAAFLPLPNGVDYCTSKAGVVHMIRSLRAQYHSSDVQFTAICPSFVKTNFIDGLDKLGGTMEPHFVVSQAIRGIQENREIVIISRSPSLFITLFGSLPSKLKYAAFDKLKMKLISSGTLE